MATPTSPLATLTDQSDLKLHFATEVLFHLVLPWTNNKVTVDDATHCVCRVLTSLLSLRMEYAFLYVCAPYVQTLYSLTTLSDEAGSDDG